MQKIKVFMVPSPSRADQLQPSGITTVLRNYGRFGESAGLEFVSTPENADVVSIHAGMGRPDYNLPIVAHCHGLYWTAFERGAQWEWKANKEVIDVVRSADVITVPSEWVANTFERDMHIKPIVLPHGVVVDDWTVRDDKEITYVLWNKNRAGDVCDPAPLVELAKRFPKIHFISTFTKESPPQNVKLVGLLPHSEMKNVIEYSTVYLATTKETFGIGTLEAMASGIPVLGFRRGGNSEIVQHGVNGYLAHPYDYDDLEEGLRYCLKWKEVLGENGRKIARKFSWENAIKILRYSYELAIERYNTVSSVTVVVPVYNKEATVSRAIASAASQTLTPKEIIVVNNNSTDGSSLEIKKSIENSPIPVRELNCELQGVAYARNVGIDAATTKYICCLDADDEIQPEFLEVCVNALENDRTLGLAYTRMEVVTQNGERTVPQWPGEYDYNGFIVKKNQVPTCNVFRKDIVVRLGGYRQRYAPNGAGAEDAELWLRMGASGYGGKLVGDGKPLFTYHLGGLVSGNRNYSEADWLYWHPWIRDGQHPFASLASPKNNAPSHPVRYYDEPFVSVVIPCTAEHAQYLWNALDSLEAQSFRRWECIIVWDTEIPEDSPKHPFRLVQKTWPWIRNFFVNKKSAGSARNVGATNARGPFLLFLDADDWLVPDAIESLYGTHKQTNSIAYSDYYGHSFIDSEEANKLRSRNRLVDYRSSDGSAIAYHASMEFDCKRAAAQPDRDTGKFYIWNLITSLVPRSWHNDIGGFDETMESWEDWDYWIRLARKGYCFTRISSPLVHYRFYSGSRREIGRQNYTDLVSYLYDKYKGEESMPCSGCKGRHRTVVKTPLPSATGGLAPMSVNDTVMVRLVDGNIGEHVISIRGEDNIVRNYGSRKEGDEFLMREGDAHKYPGKFLILKETQMPSLNEAVVSPEEPVLLVDAEPEPEIIKLEKPEPIAEKELVTSESEVEKPTTRRRRTTTRK